MCVKHDRGMSAGMNDVGKKEKNTKVFCVMLIFMYLYFAFVEKEKKVRKSELVGQ